jgi:chemotaxis protein MotB
MSGTARPLPERKRRTSPDSGKGLPVRLQRRAVASETGNEIWLLTLSDLLVLLLIFFVLFFGTSLHRQGRAVPTPPPASPVVEESAVAPLVLPRAAHQEPSPVQAASSLESDLVGILGEHPAEQGVTVERHSQYLIVTFPEQILFDSGLSRLKPSVGPLLEKVSRFILDHPGISTEIHGHTDDRPIHNQRYPSNWELSADRAAQVAKALVEQGTPPERLSIKGFGEYQPLQANDSDLSRLKNRRVEIQFSVPPSTPVP